VPPLGWAVSDKKTEKMLALRGEWL